MVATPKPAEITVRMYNVGFGDCFLLTFRYPKAFPDGRTHRHMLVDFGTTQHPEWGSNLKAAAADIAAHTGDNVDVLVATHRHADHISGFAGTATKAVMERLAPTVVVRPWTDDPDAPRDAAAPGNLDGRSREFLTVLDRRSQWLADLAADPEPGDNPTVELPDDLTDQLKNPAAIERLDGWSADGRGRYVRAGQALDLTDVLPGVSVEVLGPPTLDQVPGLANEAFQHDEFWLGLGPDLSPAAQLPGRLADAYRCLARPGGRGEARWLLSRIHDKDLATLFTVARAFDEALNNTSVILLVRAGSRSMLLSGDAQIENWTHCLDLARSSSRRGKSLRSALADIDLYKVGHHGSRNATPISLYQLWEHAGRVPADMVTLLSTLPGKHGKDHPVPKQNLVDALEAVSSLHRTDTLAEEQLFVELAASTTGAAGFAPTT